MHGNEKQNFKTGGRNERKKSDLDRRCFYLAVTDETTTVRDGGRAFQKRIGRVKPVVVM